MMICLKKIREIHQKFWKPGYGSISAEEAYFLQEGISIHKPKRFLEIGTASGISTGFIALFLSENGGKELFTLDLDKTFWVDRSKPTGFLTKKIYIGDDINISYFRGKDSTYLIDYFNGEKFDMAFIDANHQHPWPTLDMIALLPLMKIKSLVYHHDLSLYKIQTPILGIGPKYLYDQIPEALRTVINEPKKNIFYIKTTEDYMDFQDALIDALYLPWTIRDRIPETTFEKFKKIIKKYWGEKLFKAIVECSNKFSK